MFLSRRANGDPYAFFSRVDWDDKAALHSYRREFLDHVRNKLHGDFDRGFFSAWADCMRVLSRIVVPPAANTPNTGTMGSEEKKLEAAMNDKNQQTIEDFLTDEQEED
jgi:hypothetical protein